MQAPVQRVARLIRRQSFICGLIGGSEDSVEADASKLGEGPLIERLRDRLQPFGALDDRRLWLVEIEIHQVVMEVQPLQ